MKKWVILLCLFLSTVTLAQNVEEPVILSREDADKIKTFIQSQMIFLEQQQEQILILQQQIKELKKKQCTNS